MKNDLGDILADIGRLLVEAAVSGSSDILLYSEGESAMFGAKIFQDMGEHVIYFFPSGDLTKKIFELWDYAAETEKWGAVIYTISNGKFDATFEYPDDWEPEEYFSDRCNRLQSVRYGNKKILKRAE